MIKISNLSKIYPSEAGPVAALDSFSLDIAFGEFVAVMGPSGCGKSTLLNLLAGLDKPTSGELLVDGKNPARLDENRLTDYRRSVVGVIFQFYNLLPTLTVLENIMLPGLLAGISETEAAERASELARLTEIDHRLNRRPHQLSGGEMQRAAIARALVNNPPVLLADEPTGNLDSHTADHILKLLSQLPDEKGCTLVMVTHSIDAAAYARKVIRMIDGKLESENASVTVG